MRAHVFVRAAMCEMARGASARACGKFYYSSLTVLSRSWICAGARWHLCAEFGMFVCPCMCLWS